MTGVQTCALPISLYIFASLPLYLFASLPLCLSFDKQGLTVADWYSLKPLLIYVSAAENVFRQSYIDCGGIKVQSPFSMAVFYTSLSALTACLCVVNKYVSSIIFHIFIF